MTRPTSTLKQLRYSLLLVALGWMSVAWADEHARDWLMRMSEATSHLDYDGFYVHANGNRIDSLHIVHKVKPDGVYERLYAMNGAPREVVRDPQKVWCFIPDKSMGVLGERPGKDSGFPGFMVKRIDQLEQNYQLSIGDHDRVADRRATQILIVPRDNMRYGYDLWADDETGLLLRSRLIDQQDHTIEQFLFVTVDIGVDLPESALQPMTPKESLVWHKDKQPAHFTTITESDWQLSDLPTGFQVIKMARRWMPMEKDSVEHIVVSDGLSAVSVFIESIDEGHPQQDNLTSMGAVSAYTTGRDGWLITVVGEAPPDTVRKIAYGLVNKKP